MTDTALAKKPEQNLATPNGGIGIEGLEGIPTSDLPLPYYKYTGATTQDKTLADGSECPNDVFLNNATKEYYKEIRFRVITAASKKVATFNDENIFEDSYSMIGRNEETGEIFILNIRSTSLYDFRGSVLPHLVKVAKATGSVSNIVVKGATKTRTSTVKGKNITYNYAGFSIEPVVETPEPLASELAMLHSQMKNYLEDKGMESSETLAKAEAKAEFPKTPVAAAPKKKVVNPDGNGDEIIPEIDFDSLGKKPSDIKLPA